MGGYVYIIRGGKNLYKIGVTKNNPIRRLKQLQTGSATELELVRYYKLKNYRQVEKQLHKKFLRYRLRSNSEWFAVDLQDITKAVEKENTMLQNVIDFIAWLWTMALGLFVLFMIVLILDGLFFGGVVISALLDLFY